MIDRLVKRLIEEFPRHANELDIQKENDSSEHELIVGNSQGYAVT